MASDFFQRQDAAHRKTTLLLVYFGLAVLTLIGLVYLLLTILVVVMAAPEPGTSALQQPPSSLWNTSLFLVAAAVVIVVVGGGSLLKIAQLAAGGKVVALMLGGQEVLGTTADPQQRRLLNIVEEMAIASGVPVPPVYVLPGESSINAFAAGHAPGDAVVAVSQGSLNYLKRDELQGVVAHEFSHILNGDMRLNLRLQGLIFGILALSQIGLLLLWSASRPRGSSRNDGRGGLMLLGGGLYLLGLGGAFFGWLIQAAISRQREYLADASAVQFTRNPDGISGALKKIGGLEQGSRITNGHANEVSHMFLADAFFGRRLTGLFNTHPPLEARIRALDPQFDGKYPPVEPIDESKQEEEKTPPPRRFPQAIPGIPALPLPALAVAAETIPECVGHATPRKISHAETLHASIPEPLLAAVQEPFSARALIYCLLLDARPEVHEAQLAQLRAAADPRDYAETLQLIEPVRQLSDAYRLPLVDLAMPALHQMSPRQHEAFRQHVEALIRADQRLNVFEYTLRCVLNRHLDADFNQKRPQVRYRSPGPLVPQMATVLSLLAWQGQPEEDKARTAFAAGMRSYLGGDAPASQLLSRDQCSLAEFDKALQVLAEAAPAIKRQVVVSCAACITADRQVTVREAELLRAISATLNCPMPPLTVEP